MFSLEFARLEICYFLQDDTYFLVEKSVAEREIFDDFVEQLALAKNETDPKKKEELSKQGCRFSYARGFYFGSLPYGLVMGKETKKNNSKLMDELNEM